MVTRAGFLSDFIFLFEAEIEFSGYFRSCHEICLFGRLLHNPRVIAVHKILSCFMQKNAEIMPKFDILQSGLCKRRLKETQISRQEPNT